MTKKLCELQVLRSGEDVIVGAFELDADGKVVAAAAAAPRRGAGVPGAARDGNELYGLAVAADQEVARDLEFNNFFEIRVRGRVKTVREQPLDRVPAVLPGRQADRVQDD